MLRGLIEQWRLRNETKPDHIGLFIGASPQEVRDFFLLCDEFGIEKATVCVSEAGRAEDIASAVSDLGVEVVSEAGTESDRVIYLSSGRKELVNAVTELARSVERGESTSDEIDASAIEQRLPVSDEPDLIINALGDRLADKMLWQTVYSELCFIEGVDRRSFVRCLHKYAGRDRRFGR